MVLDPTLSLETACSESARARLCDSIELCVFVLCYPAFENPAFQE